MSEEGPGLFVVSAPSGAGKSTVLERVLREVRGLRFSVSHTTRRPRAGESDGVQYHFVSREAFQDLIRRAELLEWAEVHGHFYGTSTHEYAEARRLGLDLLLDLDVQGASAVRAKFEDAITIFILPPSFADLGRRLRGRGQDDEAAIARRLEAAWQEMQRCPEYDYAVVNDDLDRCVSTLRSVIEAARARLPRMGEGVRAVLATFPQNQGGTIR